MSVPLLNHLTAKRALVLWSVVDNALTTIHLWVRLRGEEGSNNEQDGDGEEWPHPSPRLGFIELREEPNRHDKMAGRASSVSAPHSMRTDAMAEVKRAPRSPSTPTTGDSRRDTPSSQASSHKADSEKRSKLFAPPLSGPRMKNVRKPLREWPTPLEARGLHPAGVLVRTHRQSKPKRRRRCDNLRRGVNNHPSKGSGLLSRAYKEAHDPHYYKTKGPQ